MAKTREKPVETLELEPDLTPADDDLVAVEEQILAAADATDQNVAWDIRIYKLDKSAGNAEEYMFSVLPSELDGLFERVRDSEGTGTYRMRAYRKANGRNAVFKQKDFRIRAPMKPQATPERPSELTAILGAMKEQSERHEQLLREILTRKPEAPPQRDPFDDLVKLTTVMKNIMPAQSETKPAPTQDMTQVFVKGVEFAQTIAESSSGSGGETNLWDIAKAVISNLPAVAALAQAQAQHAPRPAPNPQQPPRPAQVKHNTGAPPANPQPAPAPQPQAQDQQAAINEMLQYLVTRAQRNSDPGFYADWLIENVDGEIITLMLSQADPVSMAVVAEPRVASYRLWFDTLIAELRQLVNMQRDHAAMDDDATGSDATPDVPHDDPGRIGRNGSHAPNNVTLGKGW